jgi:hypothetical protein
MQFDATTTQCSFSVRCVFRVHLQGSFTWMAEQPRTPSLDPACAPTSHTDRHSGNVSKPSRMKKRRSTSSEDTFAVSKTKLKEYNVQAPLSKLMNGSHAPMDVISNSVIVLTSPSPGMIDDFGFTMKNVALSSGGGMSMCRIVPIVNTIRATSEAARAGLRSGMRIIGVGKTTIRPSHRMPSSAKDYSPVSFCKRMITEAIQSGGTLEIRVDSC